MITKLLFKGGVMLASVYTTQVLLDKIEGVYNRKTARKKEEIEIDKEWTAKVAEALERKKQA